MRCEGATDVARLGAMLRAGTVVTLDAAGGIALGQIPGLERPPPHHRRAARDGVRPGAQRVGAPERRPADERRDSPELLEHVRSRFFGKYRGRSRMSTPRTMRIKARVPAVLARTPTGWCSACVPYAGPGVGSSCCPRSAAGVWIEFEGGDVILSDLDRLLLAHRRRARPGPRPTSRRIVTKAGRSAFDDGAGSVTLQDAARALRRPRRQRRDRHRAAPARSSHRRVRRHRQRRRAGGELMPALLTAASTMIAPTAAR